MIGDSARSSWTSVLQSMLACSCVTMILGGGGHIEARQPACTLHVHEHTVLWSMWPQGDQKIALSAPSCAVIPFSGPALLTSELEQSAPQATVHCPGPWLLLGSHSLLGCTAGRGFWGGGFVSLAWSCTRTEVTCKAYIQCMATPYCLFHAMAGDGIWHKLLCWPHPSSLVRMFIRSWHGMARHVMSQIIPPVRHTADHTANCLL